ncbi:MAG: TonB-dependent receptor plug domain-containing protein [Woeseiaceae bacterium]
MHYKLRFVLSGLAILASSSLFAQVEAVDDLDQIVVTGARSPLSSRQLGSAVTVITRVDIEERQARYLTDLLRAVPGFAVSHSGTTGSQTQVRVRGSEANHVLVLIDGIRANDPATGDEFRWEYLTTSNIERVEVVRGPQSSLWGSDAVAAVVHVITKTGQDKPAFDGYAESGSFGTRNIGIGGSMGGDRWSLSAGVEQLDTDGTNISRTGSEEDESDITTFSVATQFRASNALTFDASVRVTDAYSQFDPVDFFVTGLPTDGDVATDAENLYAKVGLKYGRPESRMQHHFNVSYFDSDNRNLVDGAEDSSSASDRTMLAYQADIRLNENVLSLALEHEETEFDQSGAVVFGDPNQSQEMDITSVVADFQGLSHDRLTWLFSARFDDNSDFDDAVSGRLSLAYDLSDSIVLRGNVGTGRKNPTFTELYGFFPGQFVGNPDLKPERTTSYDVGIDKTFNDGAVVLQVSLFRQDLEDEINGFVFDPVTFLASAENMDGNSKRSGAELGVNWRINEMFSLSANYTYTDSEQEDFAGQDVREVRRPKNSGALVLSYRASDARFGAILAADYGGTRSDVFFPPFPDPSETVSLDSYVLVDLTLQYQLTPAMSLYARGTNLLDDDYEQIYGYQTPGRAGYLGLRMNFGE